MEVISEHKHFLAIRNSCINIISFPYRAMITCNSKCNQHSFSIKNLLPTDYLLTHFHEAANPPAKTRLEYPDQINQTTAYEKHINTTESFSHTRTLVFVNREKVRKCAMQRTIVHGSIQFPQYNY